MCGVPVGFSEETMRANLRSLWRILLLPVLLGMPWAAFGAEAGFIFIYNDPLGPEVRKVRKLERVEGFYVARSFSGGTERVDAFRVWAVIDLASLQPTQFDSGDDLANARALELRTKTAVQQNPLLARHLTAPLAQLRTEIERAERGEKKIEGKWLTAEQVAALRKGQQSTITRGTLRLRNGTTYRDVEIVSVNPQELRIFHADGAAQVPMQQVPEEFKRKYLTPPPPAGAK